MQEMESTTDDDIFYYKKSKRPKFVGRYLVGDLIGEGSYSKVKEVIDAETLERRAIKIMKKQRLKKIPNGEENVRQETKLLRKLNHINVIKLIDVIYNEQKQKLYIVMEYCVTVLQELFDKAPNNRLPISQAHGYFVQLIEGLEYLHSQGIVHKDIKPSNLLINNSGIVKITDLGVSEQIDRYSSTDTCYTSQGSPAFQAPELADGTESFSGFKVDVWSCGVTLYSITTGRYPFEGENIYRLFENISKAEFKIPDDLDPALTNLLRGMLTKDPEKRYSLDKIKQHDWFRRNHPQITKHISIPRRRKNASSACEIDNGDEIENYRSMTVLPYLFNLHYPQHDQQNFDTDMQCSDDEMLLQLDSPCSHSKDYCIDSNIVQQGQLRLEGQGSECVEDRSQDFMLELDKNISTTKLTRESKRGTQIQPRKFMLNNSQVVHNLHKQSENLLLPSTSNASTFSGCTSNQNSTMHNNGNSNSNGKATKSSHCRIM